MVVDCESEVAVCSMGGSSGKDVCVLVLYEGVTGKSEVEVDDAGRSIKCDDASCCDAVLGAVLGVKGSSSVSLLCMVLS